MATAFQRSKSAHRHRFTKGTDKDYDGVKPENLNKLHDVAVVQRQLLSRSSKTELQEGINMEDEPVVYKADPLWLDCVENMYKMLFVFISSINYYIYCWKLLILKGKCSTCCRPKKSFTQGENIQLQLTMSKKSTRGSSGT